jgi:hypothetical protein
MSIIDSTPLLFRKELKSNYRTMVWDNRALEMGSCCRKTCICCFAILFSPFNCCCNASGPCGQRDAESFRPTGGWREYCTPVCHGNCYEPTEYYLSQSENKARDNNRKGMKTLEDVATAASIVGQTAFSKAGPKEKEFMVTDVFEYLYASPPPPQTMR